MRNILFKITKNLLVLVIFLFLCFEILINLNSLQNTFWYPNDLRVNIISGNFYVNDLDTGQTLIRIAPYQDFFYENGQRQSLNFLYKVNKPNSLFENLLQNVFLPTTWTWHALNEKIDYQYNFAFSPNKIIVSRAIYQPQANISGLGQSLYYCSSCVVINPQTQTVYFYSQDLDSPLLKEALNLNYPLFHLPSKTIFGVNELAIVNLKNGHQVNIQVPPEKTATLEDADNILVLPTSTTSNGNWHMAKEVITIPYE